MRFFWNNVTVIEESKKYKTKTDFHKCKSGAYLYALKHNLLSQMVWLKQPKWNNESVLEESRKYSSRGEFAKKSNWAYKYALKHDLLKQMVWLKPKNLFGDKSQKIDNVYAYEFVDFKTVYVGRSIDVVRRDKQHRNGKSSVYNFAVEKNINIPEIIILEKDITILDGQKFEKKWLDEYIKKGWIVLNKGKCGEGCGSLGALNTINRKWNRENVINESKKYKSKSEFKKNSNGAYNYARKHNILCEMIWLKKPDIWNKKWNNDESVINESKKYKSKTEFKKNSRGAHCYAWRHHLLDKMYWLNNNLKNDKNEFKKERKF